MSFFKLANINTPPHFKTENLDLATDYLKTQIPKEAEQREDIIRVVEWNGSKVAVWMTNHVSLQQRLSPLIECLTTSDDTLKLAMALGTVLFENGYNGALIDRVRIQDGKPLKFTQIGAAIFHVLPQQPISP